MTTLLDAIKHIRSERPHAMISNGAEDFTLDGLIETLQDAQAYAELHREVHLGKTGDDRFVIRGIKPDGQWVDTDNEPLFIERVEVA